MFLFISSYFRSHNNQRRNEGLERERPNKTKQKKERKKSREREEREKCVERPIWPPCPAASSSSSSSSSLFRPLPCFTMNEKANVTKELNARHRKVPLLLLSLFHLRIVNLSGSNLMVFLSVCLIVNQFKRKRGEFCYLVFVFEFSVIRDRFGFLLYLILNEMVMDFGCGSFDLRVWIDSIRRLDYQFFFALVLFFFLWSFCCLLRIWLNSGL